MTDTSVDAATLAAPTISDPTTTATKRKGLGIGGTLSAAWLLFVVAVALLAPVLPLEDPLETLPGIAREGPGTNGAVLGGDNIGRDMLSRTIWGARSSLIISVSAVLIGLVIGGVLGLTAGYFRGRVDTVLSSLFSALLAFPPLVLALSLIAFLRKDPETGGGGLSTVQILVIALGIVSIPILAAITRSTTLSWAQREFVLAAKAQGATNARIMFREVLPNVMPAMFSISLLGVGVAIIAEGGLSLLGVGVELPRASWGNIIAEGRGNLRNSPHIVFIPSIAIFLTVMSLNFLGDVIRSRFDVRESAL